MSLARIAIIPARGGSKRIPRKNIRLFAGKPMIGYPIEAAQRAGLFDHVIVSTDDDEIAMIARSLGAEVPFRRPVELADDFTPTVPVIAHAISACRSLGWAVEQACCIYPCVPFIDPKDLVEALRVLESRAAPYVFPVTTFPSPIQRALKRDKDGRVAPFDPDNVQTRTQDLEPAFYDAGQFYWGLAGAWLNGDSLHGNGSSIVLPHWRVVDIDTPADWERAEAMHRTLRS